MRKQTKIAAIASAAALLAIGASVTAFAGWKQTGDDWYYELSNGDLVTESWRRDGNDYFYLDSDGVMVRSSLLELDNGTYYVNENGARITGAWVAVPNDDSIEVGQYGEVPDTLYYYFDATGKAVRATDNYVIKTVRRTNTDSTTGKFIFDSNGIMQEGWIETETNKVYYGATLDDIGIVQQDVVEGQLLNKWAYMEIPEDYYTGSDYDDNFGWYYFNSNERLENTTKYLAWNGISNYYKFDENGVMIDGWIPTTEDGFGMPTPPEATSAESYSALAGQGIRGAITSNDWVYASKPTDETSYSWYYMVNVRDGKNVHRGVAFGSDGETVNYNGKDTSVVYAKIINNKTYFFDNTGAMKTGLIEIPKTTGQTWHGVPARPLTAGYTYYASKASYAGGGSDGRMLTGKVTETSEGETFYYYFYKDSQKFGAEAGTMAKDAIVDGYLYGPEGKRIQADAGERYRVYELENDTVVKKSNDPKVLKTLTAGTNVLVNGSGKVVEKASSKGVEVDEGWVWDVSGYVATER